ncbi:Metallo-peptidase family M12B Reprolysin-like [Luteibacter sp. UNCMF331Sha3.1]|uniref:reprolysin-like metallopeptidase n=1 Tax=Luteibacter sp. UNCMF331Sha3.1 TaxID=1502760 RepID=UPI0008AE23A9|nr:hypothetical protein [Luteibacter sp. UNCMF331Sha3.1]SEM47280.1 Metallo-peptidase family M12B Reprolysin-like [Luteibacter sp. UNCMF331Sha3.1]
MTSTSLAACCLLALLATAPTVRASNALDRFDAAVADGLPRTIVLGDTHGARGRDAPGDVLTIAAALDVDVRFTDGVPARLYTGTWRGEPAVMTRSDHHMDITVTGRDGVTITGFTDDSSGSHQVAPPANPGPAQAPRASDAASRRHAGARPAMLAARSARASGTTNDLSYLAPAVVPPTVTFWIFLHDDTKGTSRQHINAGYVAWWIADMKRILPSYRLRVFYIDNRPGMTDLSYGNKETDMWRWTLAADAYAAQAKLVYQPGKSEYKFMLITKDLVAPSTVGLAWLGGDQAMVSLKGSYNTVAHEFGHTFGGVHEDSAVWWSYVWPCETNLYPTDYALLSNCYRYTAANEARIRTYLTRGGDGPQPLDPASSAMTLVD